jgi:hydrogenase maturation protease
VSEPRVSVIGLGNVLMGDDAFGPWVIETLLAAYAFPEDVSVLDLGTPGLDLLPYIADLEALVLVDTVRADGPPGSLRLYRRDDILRHPPQARLSPHDPGVKEALLSAEFAGRGPREVLLIGAVPAETAMAVRLSPALKATVPSAVQAVLEELGRLGAPPTARPDPGAPDIWWEPVAEGGRGAPA